MNHLHPVFAAVLGREVLVDYLVLEAGGNVGHVRGILGLVVDADDVPTELAIEMDGSTTFVRVNRVLAISTDR